MLKSLHSFSIHISQKENNLVLLFFFFRCVLWLLFYSSLLGCHLPYTSWLFPSKKPVHFLPYSTLCQQCLPKPPLATIPSFTLLSTKDSGLPSKRQFFARRTWMIWTVCPCEGCDESKYISNTEGRARKLTLSLTVEHAQWWIFLLLSTAISFRFKEKKTHLGIKTSLFYTIVYFWGTASLISFVLPFSDNHFSK